MSWNAISRPAVTQTHQEVPAANGRDKDQEAHGREGVVIVGVSILPNNAFGKIL